jgi:hypothetical protein
MKETHAFDCPVVLAHGLIIPNANPKASWQPLHLVAEEGHYASMPTDLAAVTELDQSGLLGVSLTQTLARAFGLFLDLLVLPLRKRDLACLGSRAVSEAGRRPRRGRRRAS